MRRITSRRDFIAGAASAMSISIATRVLAEPLAAKESELFDHAKFAIPEKFRRHPLFNTPHCGVNFGFLVSGRGTA